MVAGGFTSVETTFFPFSGAISSYVPRANTTETEIISSNNILPFFDVGELQEALAVRDMVRLPATLAFLLGSDN